MTIKTKLKNFTLLADVKGNKKVGGGLSISIVDNGGFDLDTIRQTGQKACGDCKHARPTDGRVQGACYVYSRPGGGQGALGGILSDLNKATELPLMEFFKQCVQLAKGFKYCRIGKFGDPAASTETVAFFKGFIGALRDADIVYTGYTHNWEKHRARPLRGLLMASCDTYGEALQAIDKNWGVYQVIGRNEETQHLHCPSQRQQKKKKAVAKVDKIAALSISVPTCAECGLCDGKRVRIIQVQKH